MSKITLPIPILILQHPQEPSRKDHAVSSASILSESIHPCAVKVGLSWRNLESALKGFEELGDLSEFKKPANWGTLYLGTQKQGEKRISTEPGLYFMDGKDEPICGIILLDGTWAQAKTLWWRNAWLLKTRRMHLIPKQKSLYGNVRREPRPECVSTVEAAAETLSFLGIDASIEIELKKKFAEQLHEYKSSRVKISNPK
jgi:DTW domain-containing protein YfiP